MSLRDLRPVWLASLNCSVLGCRPLPTVAVHSPSPGPELIVEGPLALFAKSDAGASRARRSFWCGRGAPGVLPAEGTRDAPGDFRDLFALRPSNTFLVKMS